MRNTDSEPRPFKPLGEKVTPPVSDSPPTWKPKPNAPGFETDSAGRLRTANHPLPEFVLPECYQRKYGVKP